MNGPPLTPNEAVASVARRVDRLEGLGLDRDQAIQRVALETGIDSEKVRWCVVNASAGSAAIARLPRSTRRRRAALALAAAL